MFGLTSIVVVTRDQFAYTRLCVASIARCTPEPYELVFVDNGSRDGTVEWLKGKGRRVESGEPEGQKSEVRSQESAADGPVRVTVIANAENRGFPTAANDGIRAASGQQLLLLNNDTIVTPGWLGRMLRALQSDPAIGLVGPCSNFVSGPQQVAVPYGGGGQRAESGGPEHACGSEGQREESGGPEQAVVLDLMEQFARDWGEANACRLQETNRLVGFCLLIRCEVIERIGLLDERFGIGCFEDDDYCRRAIEAGYRCVIARDAFVHHFGGATFIGGRVDHGELMRRNERLFREKWGVGGGRRAEGRKPGTVESSVAVGAPEAAAHQSSFIDAAGPQPSALRPQLSLCMIARDNERTIRAALEGTRPWVDEMVVVDTGSKDQTPQIAQGLGARVFQFPWCDDFSAARNESIRHARGQWIFWMDTDDTIDAENGRKLRELVQQGFGVLPSSVSAGSGDPRQTESVPTGSGDPRPTERGLPPNGVEAGRQCSNEVATDGSPGRQPWVPRQTDTLQPRRARRGGSDDVHETSLSPLRPSGAPLEWNAS